ncbi:uncharacterized protein K444DRAFT_611514 [Hyaloscypha bicolor E]|uniref:Uncharacterized protein n=1 Tax=Hyaloscypha bicolor E TaxID=1095630 RepID=A0A2J6TE31_9HELO|nr:uncharacterized protein K444DRAFT_611514 [Hyaloscypha bicolor E]PMD61263.1 hypothetical protein K444DRAFT_611514 [Hyaloscypha bicolor E]
MLQDEHWIGPLSEEDFTTLEESWKGVPRAGEGPTGLQELRTAFYKKKEYSTAASWRWKSPYRHWEGWEGPQEEEEEEGTESWEGSAGRGEYWEGL